MWNILCSGWSALRHAEPVLAMYVEMYILCSQDLGGEGEACVHSCTFPKSSSNIINICHQILHAGFILQQIEYKLILAALIDSTSWAQRIADNSLGRLETPDSLIRSPPCPDFITCFFLSEG